jgi:hypothetical protein
VSDLAFASIAVAQVVLAGALVWYTRRMTQAASLQAEAVRPRPYVFLRLDRVADSLVLTNTGQRVATNIRIEVNEDFILADSPGGLLGDARLVSQPVKALPPGSAVRESRGNTLLPRPNREDVIAFTLSYGDAAGRTYAESFTYSLGELGWIGGTPPFGPPLAEAEAAKRHNQMMKALEGIARAIHHPAHRDDERIR